ncbi:MAG: adenylosuccinate synthase, partial [Planctomycetota bacterium]
HLIPSGILRQGLGNVIGNGVAFDPAVAWEEIENLRARGVKADAGNLHISAAANVVMPWHKLADRLSEESLGNGRIGTTARGIGPCYADKATRSTALRVADLLDADVLAEKVGRIAAIKNALFAGLYGHDEPLDSEAIAAEYADYGRRMAEMVINTGALLRRAIAAGESICFEGGQGSLLDIDHGTFPFVTSSSVTACGVPSGAGVPPKAVGLVVGIVKAYTSRVGAGPFPSEQDNEIGDLLRERGREYGTTTGRPRRCGWLDAVAVRYAAELSGVDEIALMLLDVPGTLESLRICTGYSLDGKPVEEFDAAALDRIESRYEELPGWSVEIDGARRFEDLPPEAQHYVNRVEQILDRPVGIISVGPERDQTILHHSALGTL